MIEIDDWRKRDQIIKPFLMYSSTIRRYTMKQFDLNIYEYEALLFLHGCVMLRGYFTKEDFKINNFNYNWDRKRMDKLIEKEWIKKAFDLKGSYDKGNKDKYTFTASGKTRMTKLYNYHIGATPIPEGKTNIGKIAVRNGKKHRKMSRSYDQMRKDKDFTG